jgi:hypothetical protein
MPGYIWMFRAQGLFQNRQRPLKERRGVSITTTFVQVTASPVEQSRSLWKFEAPGVARSSRSQKRAGTNRSRQISWKIARHFVESHTAESATPCMSIEHLTQSHEVVTPSGN